MRISTRCYAVTGMGLVPPWCVNAGFVVGEHTTLIADTGANAFAAATIHGYATAARPGNQITVINLEKHFDHIGGNSYFRSRGIDVFGHPGIERTEEEFRREIDEFNAAIPDEARRARGEASAFYEGTALANPNRAISEEMVLELGDVNAQVLHTPGHTPTNISVFVPGERVLFCGDCLVNGYLPNLKAGSVVDWWQWLGSLDRIAGLEPEVVVPGHGHVVRGAEVKPLIRRVRTVIEEAISAQPRLASSSAQRA